MTDAFYGLAAFLPGLNTKTLLTLFQWTPPGSSAAGLYSIEKQRHDRQCTGEIAVPVSPSTIRILKNVVKAQNTAIRENFAQTKALVPGLTCLQKKALCRQLSEYPSTDEYPAGLSRSEIIRAAGIRHTAYYKALHKANYGLQEERKKAQDEEDLKALKAVVEYKGFEKGVRQIYMMLPDLTGRHMAISKIRRLLRSAGIRTKIPGAQSSASEPPEVPEGKCQAEPPAAEVPPASSRRGAAVRRNLPELRTHGIHAGIRFQLH